MDSARLDDPPVTSDLHTLDPSSDTPPVADPGPTDRAPGRRVRTAALVAAVAVLGGVAGSAATLALTDERATSLAGVSEPHSRSVDEPSSPASRLDGDALDVAGVVAKAGPAVVSLQVGYGGRIGGTGAGTGVILTAAGEVLTNAHVVAGATSVNVTLTGESQARPADVLGSDAAADLALLRIRDASDLPTADLGRSADVRVGDDVVAIGNSLALRGGPTVTRGIVSGLDRSLPTEQATMTGLIQTDASISSGNSGGPLVNATGEVIGINTAVAASGQRTAAENIGFAIPVDQAVPVVERLRGNSQAAAPGYLGVRSQDPTDGSRGAVLVEVVDGSPAASAGLEIGDLITHVGDRAVDGAASLAAAVRSHQPGATVPLKVVRDGQEMTLDVELGRPQ